MKYPLLFLSAFFFLFSACIGDDIILDNVPERLRINNTLDSIQINTSYQFEATYFNNIGQIETRNIDWFSSDDSVLSIDNQGLATANMLGGASIIARISLENNSVIEDEFELWVTEGPTVIGEEDNERSGQINTTSSYTLTGDFILKKEDNLLTLTFADNYEASSSLPGLYVYLSNNPNSTNGAFEIGEVTTFNGAHSYTISGVEIDQYSHVLYFCKPFSVKVGDGEIE